MVCQAQSKSGYRCKAQAQSGSDFCFFHNPASRNERETAQRRGGQANARSLAAIPDADIDLSDPSRILTLVTRAANLVCCGRLDAKRAHALGHLADCALKAYALGTLKQRQDRIERLLEEQRNRPADPGEAERILHFVPEDEIQPAGPPQRVETDTKSPFGDGDHGRDR